MQESPRIVGGNIATSIVSIFSHAKPLADKLDEKFLELLSENDITDPSSDAARQFHATLDMKKICSEIVMSDPGSAALLLEACALAMGSQTVCLSTVAD